MSIILNLRRPVRSSTALRASEVGKTNRIVLPREGDLDADIVQSGG